jgi:uncharacterized protein (TIGR03032 family)
MKDALPPFSVTYTPNIPEILFNMRSSLALSTFQAGKVIFMSATDKNKLVQLPRTFANAMGVAASGSKLAIACRNDVILLKNFPQLANKYPAKPKTYDSLFVPQCRYYTGALDLHDMNFVQNKLIAVNTLFSCLAEINEEFSFQPVWQPHFISGLTPEDRCHLNGMAIQQDEIVYITALGNTDTPNGWRKNKIGGGIIIHLPTNQIIHSGLSMPHSPRMYDDKLYFLNSALGELRLCDTEKGTSEVIVSLGGFARGMARLGDYLFIGMSKLRHTTDVFKSLPIAKTSFAGISVVSLSKARIVGQIRYESSVEEIYDVKILQGLSRPGILNSEKIEKHSVIVLPGNSFWAVDKAEET